MIRHLGGVLLEASDTCSGTLHNVIFALTLYPEVRKKAAEEMERVVGSDRAPSWEDLPNLPYTLALIEEVSRCKLKHSLMKVFLSTDKSLQARRPVGPSSCDD